MTYDSLLLGHSPIGHWELAEPSGTTMEDSSPNNRDGTYHGGVTLAQPGLLTDGDTAAALDGSDDYGQVPAASLPAYTVLTALAWFKPGRLSEDNPIFIRANYLTSLGAANYGFHIRWDSDRLHLGLGTSGGGYRESTAGPALVLGKTYMAALTYDGAAMKGYLGATDGSLAEVYNVAKSGTLWTAANQPLRVGADAGGIIYAQGTIGKTALINAALSLTDLQALFDEGATGGGPTETGITLAGRLPAIRSSLSIRSYTPTDTSNRRGGRIRGGYAIHADNTDPVVLPAAAAMRRDKALWYPDPDLVDGRPT